MSLEMAPIREAPGDGDGEGHGRLPLQNSTKMFRRKAQRATVPASVRSEGSKRILPGEGLAYVGHFKWCPESLS